MVNTLIDWLLSLITELAKFGNWLTQPLPYLNISPLAIFSFTGILLVLGFLLLRLVIGG